MTVEEAAHGDVRVVRVAGEIDVRSAPLLRQKLEGAAGVAGPRTVINLARLRYIDSAGLGVLVAALKTHAARGGKLVLVSPEPEIRHILEITRLIRHFDIHDSEATALAALG